MKKGIKFVLAFSIIFALILLPTIPVMAAPENITAIQLAPSTPDSMPDLPEVEIPAAFGLIPIIAYGLAEVMKRATSIKTERLPLILAIFGMLMGIAFVLFHPELRMNIPSNWQDIGWGLMKGAIYGSMSGLAAVGANQVFKQGAKLKVIATPKQGGDA